MHKKDDDLIWIIRGNQRKEVFFNLPDEEFLPNKLRKTLQNNDLSLSLREMSRHLRDFNQRNLVECINKNDPYNKIYRLTKKGRNLKSKLIKCSI